MLNSLVMQHIPNDQVYTIIMLCQILGNQVYAIREVDIWRRALTTDGFEHHWRMLCSTNVLKYPHYPH